MVAEYHGRTHTQEFVRERARRDRRETGVLHLVDVAEALGLRGLVAHVPYTRLGELRLPAVAQFGPQRFVVVYAVTRRSLRVADPATGLRSYTPDEFRREWLGGGASDGTVLLFEPTAALPPPRLAEADRTPVGFRFLLGYVRPYRALVAQLALSMAVGSVLALIGPFLTQSLVDVGVNTRNMGFVYAILAAQIMLALGSTAVGVVRAWILVHVGTRVNVSIVADFLTKLTRLPIAFFDARRLGDLLQRIGDHQRIEMFLTSSVLSTAFSLLNLIVFGTVLLIYSWSIFLTFFVGSTASALWLVAFMRRRRDLDYRRFHEGAASQGALIQLITGMPELKLAGAERHKRWEWERIQARMFHLAVSGVGVDQMQQVGSLLINQLKNTAITFLAAREVIDGRMSLGVMLAVSYVAGQLNVPIAELYGFLHAAQEARISIERIGEIYARPDEGAGLGASRITSPVSGAVEVRGLTFRYGGPDTEAVLDALDLDIPYGRTTAIVGASGSGKTTLCKLMLKFYEPTAGRIDVGGIALDRVDARAWRARCGAVLQDGVIFSDTIAQNIALGDESGRRDRIEYASALANVDEFARGFPLGLETRVGPDGHGLSQGQRQRILIARAIYKDPEYLFFDEATSALDANNERAISERLGEFTAGRTVVVIAHRLSTVRGADQIVVLERGRVVERGPHEALVAARGAYYELVRNQLELGA